MSVPYYADDSVTLWHGDALAVLSGMPSASVDSVVTDPPYGLEFMGKEWDAPWKGTAASHADARTRRASELDDPSKGKFIRAGVNAYEAGKPFQQWCTLWAAECLRVLKPGGHLLAFGGSRTWHRLACAVEDAGFEIRDSIAWLYGSGFPKSLDVSRAIDKAAGAKREVVGSKLGLPGYSLAPNNNAGRVTYGTFGDAEGEAQITAPATPDARTWQGWGTALKPAWENVVVGRKAPAHGDRIGSRLDALEDECGRLASDAGRSSAPTPADSPEETIGSAPVRVATQREDGPARTTRTGAEGASSAATDTSWSEWQATTCSNIVTSWKRSWAVLSELTSTSTTATTSGTTTDPTTLWSCLSKLTEPSTLLDPTSPGGLSSLAGIVDDLFGAALLNWRATRTLTATEAATSGTQRTSQPAAGRSHLEPIVVGRKPLAIGTVAANVLAHGTGALNIDGCRVGDGEDRTSGGLAGSSASVHVAMGDGWHGGQLARPTAGRWPTNVVLDESQAAELDRQTGTLHSQDPATRYRASDPSWSPSGTARGRHGESTQTTGADSGGASRFFPTFHYEAKAPTLERPRHGETAHPTVKPLDLMRWLVRLVTPPGGTVLDPFAGSGTTAEACVVEGFRCVLIEREADYLPLIVARLSKPIAPVLDLEGLA